MRSLILAAVSAAVIVASVPAIAGQAKQDDWNWNDHQDWRQSARDWRDRAHPPHWMPDHGHYWWNPVLHQWTYVSK